MIKKSSKMLSDLLEKREMLKIRAIKNYCELNKNIFGNVNAKKLVAFVEKLYGKSEK